MFHVAAWISMHLHRILLPAAPRPQVVQGPGRGPSYTTANCDLSIGCPVLLTMRWRGIVKLRPTVVVDAQHGGFTAGSSPVSWGSIDELFVNLTIPYQFMMDGDGDGRGCE